MTQSVPAPLTTSAHVRSLAVSRDGYSAMVEVQAGGLVATRTLNWDSNGRTPLLDGQAFADAADLGKEVASFFAVAEKRVVGMSDALVQMAQK